MNIVLLCLSFLFTLAEPRAARIEKIRNEIAELQSKIADKEADIVRLSPVKKVNYLFLDSAIKPGTAGPFGRRIEYVNNTTEPEVAAVQIESIIDETTMIVSVLSRYRGLKQGVIVFDASPKQVVISHFDTKGMTKGAKFQSPPFLTLGTKTIDGKVYVHVDPYTPKKK